MKELQGTGHRAPGTGHRVTVDGDMGGSNVDMCSVGDSCIVDWGEEMGTPRQVGSHRLLLQVMAGMILHCPQRMMR
jgi:hypothetical protein